MNKVVGPQPATLLKKRLQCKCLPVNFGKSIRFNFDRTPPMATFEVWQFFADISKFSNFETMKSQKNKILTNNTLFHLFFKVSLRI